MTPPTRPPGSLGADLGHLWKWLGCSTVVSVDDAARSAVAARLTQRPLPKVRFVVVGDRPLPGATRLSPDAVSVRALSEVVTGAAAR
ncbi:hypothetical protein AB0D74_47675 [Streptomyces sp. NPDC048278]|uniref:hypothetical protein n=1 Tax=Streptomyces sp. NPDC048278 TaxID=3155809 RepID=UPI0034343E6D